jgi:hypothetical protein
MQTRQQLMQQVTETEMVKEVSPIRGARVLAGASARVAA